MKIRTKHMRPKTLAWLRRPELDGPGFEVWEKPDGSLFAAQPGVEPVIVKVTEPWPVKE